MQAQETLEEIRLKHELPALGAVAIVDGKPQPAVVVGKRKFGGTDSALATDAFHLGSDTKAMTAALIGLLVDQGKLSGKTTLGGVIAETPLAWKATTIETLLAHQAGLTKLEPRGKNLLYLHGFTGPLEKQRTRWLTERLADAPDKTVGKFAYSNAGYTLLGVIAERVTGKPWERLIVENLWKPLNITGGGFGAPPLMGQHRLQGKKPQPLAPAQIADNPPLMGPAGAVHLPLGEWAKFVAVFADPEHQTLLKPETLTWLSTPSRGGDYNGGWMVTPRPWAGGAALTHGGSNTFNFCVAWAAPQKRFAALVATNVAGDEATTACDAVVGTLIRRFLKPG